MHSSFFRCKICDPAMFSACPSSVISEHHSFATDKNEQRLYRLSLAWFTFYIEIHVEAKHMFNIYLIIQSGVTNIPTQSPVCMSLQVRPSTDLYEWTRSGIAGLRVKRMVRKQYCCEGLFWAWDQDLYLYTITYLFADTIKAQLRPLQILDNYIFLTT